MTRQEAIEAVKAGETVELVHRDTTGEWIDKHVCWLEADSDLVFAHPTDPRAGAISAPADGVYRRAK
jgi:hypothetical protein